MPPLRGIRTRPAHALRRDRRQARPLGRRSRSEALQVRAPLAAAEPKPRIGQLLPPPYPRRSQLAVENGHLKRIPRFKAVPSGNRLPKFLTPDETRAVIEQARKTGPEIHRLAVFSLMGRMPTFRVSCGRLGRLRRRKPSGRGQGKARAHRADPSSRTRGHGGTPRPGPDLPTIPPQHGLAPLQQDCAFRGRQEDPPRAQALGGNLHAEIGHSAFRGPEGSRPRGHPHDPGLRQGLRRPGPRGDDKAQVC